VSIAHLVFLRLGLRLRYRMGGWLCAQQLATPKGSSRPLGCAAAPRGTAVAFAVGPNVLLGSLGGALGGTVDGVAGDSRAYFDGRDGRCRNISGRRVTLLGTVARPVWNRLG
jgi:hypothetical protein